MVFDLSRLLEVKRNINELLDEQIRLLKKKRKLQKEIIELSSKVEELRDFVKKNKLILDEKEK